MYKNFLFDLDGTLLPMNMEQFVKAYLNSICRRFSPVFGVPHGVVANAIIKAVSVMGRNNGTKVNKDVFMQTVSTVIGIDISTYSDELYDYYLSEFIEAKKSTGYNPVAKICIDYIKEHKPQNGRLILATNPIFPEIAALRRLAWAGVSGNDFDYITSYENSEYCKPNLNFYKAICQRCKINPEESIMIGNDVDEDMCAAQLGFDTFLITDCLINRRNADYSQYRNGNFEEFYNFLTDSFMA